MHQLKKLTRRRISRDQTNKMPSITNQLLLAPKSSRNLKLWTTPPIAYYQFYLIDMPNYLPTQHTFEIADTVGANSVSAIFLITLVDSCLTTTLENIKPYLFADKNLNL